MNPYQVPADCDVCGGPGMGRPADVGHLWSGGRMRHNDPAVCAYYLEQKRERLEAIARKAAVMLREEL